MAWITLINKINQSHDMYRSMDLVDWHPDTVPIGDYTKERFHTRIINGFTKEEFQELTDELRPLVRDLFKQTIDGKYYYKPEKGFSYIIQPVWKPTATTIKWLKIKSKPHKLEVNFSILTSSDWDDLEKNVLTKQQRISLIKNKCRQNLTLEWSNFSESIDKIESVSING